MTLKDDKNKNNSNWSNDLLIKDQEGKFHNLNQDLDTFQEEKNSNNFNLDKAPQNDSFEPTPSLNGQANDKADFSFHPEDKYQLDKIAKELPKDNSKKYSLNKIVNKLIIKHNLKLDKENKEYFSNIIFDFFRNRKSIIVLREALNTKILVNKKPLKKDFVDNLVLIIKGIYKKIEKAGGLVVMIEEVKLEKVEDNQKPIEPKIKEIKNIVKAPEPKIIPQLIKTEIKPEIKIKEKPKVEKKIKEEKVAKKESKFKDALPKVSRPSKISSDKNKIDDVLSQSKKTKKVLSGPIDELRNLKLSDFQRLGDNAQARADKILYKINLLAEDSYTKKSEGIKAWRNNEIYKLYLQIGNESLENDKEVKETINKYQKEKKEFLTEKEFTAISDLNKLLRF